MSRNLSKHLLKTQMVKTSSIDTLCKTNKNHTFLRVVISLEPTTWSMLLMMVRLPVGSCTNRSDKNMVLITENNQNFQVSLLKLIWWTFLQLWQVLSLKTHMDWPPLHPPLLIPWSEERSKWVGDLQSLKPSSWTKIKSLMLLLVFSKELQTYWEKNHPSPTFN